MAKSKKKSSLKALSMAIVATILLIIFLVIALLLMPRPYIPEFEIGLRDWIKQQQWETHGEIAIFDEKIHPGSGGEFEFIITNESETDLQFGIVFTEYLETTASAHPFMQYRLKMNNVYIAKDSEWRHASQMNFQNLRILPSTSQLFTLEWRWEFENGTDANDTLIGRAGGELSIHCLVLAEVYPE